MYEAVGGKGTKNVLLLCVGKKAGSVTPGNALIREVGKRVH